MLGASVASAGDYSSAVLADGPAAYYRLGDPAAALPAARNSGSLGAGGDGVHLGARRGVGGAIAGSANGSAYYDGSGARTVIPYTAALNPPATQPFTIEAWVKPGIDGLGNAQAPLFNRRSTNPRQGWVFFQRPSGTGFTFRMYNENGSSQSVDITGGPYTVGEWTHLAATWDGSTATLYVNGLNVGSQVNTYVPNSAAPFSIGAYGADNPGDNPYTGSIDEVAFYASALSPAQILDHHDNGVNPARTTGYEALVVADGAVVSLHLNEPNAVNLGSLGARADGTHTVGVTLGAPGALAGSTDTAATYGGIQQADGGSPTTVPYDPALNPAGSFTVEAWVKPGVNGFGNAQCPWHNRASTATNGNGNRTGWDFFQRDQSVGWNWRLFNGSGGTRVFDLTGGPYTVGQWQHLVGVYDASGPVARLYQNGELVASSSTPNGTYAPKTSGDMAIGSYSNPLLNDLGYENAFTGSIDEVAIYLRALSLGEVQSHHANGTNPARGTPYETLITSHGAAGYWRLNESTHDPEVNRGTLGATADGVHSNTFIIDGPRSPAYLGFDPANLARDFDGIDSYVELGNPAGLNFSGAISLEAWVKPAALTSIQSYVLGHGTNHNASAETALRIFSDWYEIGANDGTGHFAEFDATPDLGAGNWVHVVGTHDGTAWNLFRNGVLVATNPDATGALAVSNANWAIGARGRWKDAFGILAGAAMPDRAFTGGIDEAAIYDYALSPVQAASHFFTGLYGAQPLTIARSGPNVILTWPGGTLQGADSVNGPYSDVPMGSPATIPATEARRFYRIRFQ